LLHSYKTTAIAWSAKRYLGITRYAQIASLRKSHLADKQFNSLQKHHFSSAKKSFNVGPIWIRWA